MEESTLYELSVAPLENFNGLATYPYSASFTTKSLTSSGLSDMGKFKAYSNHTANYADINSRVSTIEKVLAISTAD